MRTTRKRFRETGRAAGVLLAFGAILCTATAASAGTAGLVYTPASAYGDLKLPLRTQSLAIADFDGDGQVDTAVAGTYMSGVLLVLNTAPAPTQIWVGTGAWPIALAAVDFDGNGATDLAVALQDAAAVQILANPGDGRLQPAGTYGTGAGPQSIACADVDGDARPDLIVANRWDENVTVLRNEGSGFHVRQTIAVPAEPNALAVADFDGDADIDVAVACADDDAVRILRNTGGSLMLIGIWPAGPYPVAVSCADVNNDGTPDLVVADREAPQVTVLLNDGAGRFDQQREVSLGGEPAGPFAPPVDVLLGDSDYDGNVDMQAAGCTWRNNGAGDFALVARQEWANVVYGLRWLGEPYPFLGRVYAPNLHGYAAGGVRIEISYERPTADINNDGQVNVFDLQRLAKAWNSTCGESRYDPLCDLTGDEKVNVFDLQALAADWNK